MPQVSRDEAVDELWQIGADGRYHEPYSEDAEPNDLGKSDVLVHRTLAGKYEN